VKVLETMTTATSSTFPKQKPQCAFKQENIGGKHSSILNNQVFTASSLSSSAFAVKGNGRKS
jgi:hypothetical protein